jgi:hypothetical protein
MVVWGNNHVVQIQYQQVSISINIIKKELNTHELTVVRVFGISKSANVLATSPSSIVIATIDTDPEVFDCPRFDGLIGRPC